jgi:ketosteroid isomerase-like protein
MVRIRLSCGEREGDAMTADTPNSTALVAGFVRLEREWADAVIRQDRDALERLLAADFALVVSAAPERAVPRAMWLDQALGPYRVRSAQVSGVAVRQVAADLASVSLLLAMEASVGGVDRSTTFFVVDIWRRASAGWQVVARYSSRPEEASASSRAVTGE